MLPHTKILHLDDEFISVFNLPLEIVRLSRKLNLVQSNVFSPTVVSRLSKFWSDPNGTFEYVWVGDVSSAYALLDSDGPYHIVILDHMLGYGIYSSSIVQDIRKGRFENCGGTLKNAVVCMMSSSSRSSLQCPVDFYFSKESFRFDDLEEMLDLRFGLPQDD